jgi:hypothetical protein
MQQKILNISTVLKGFDGDPLLGEDKEPLDLKTVLLVYVMNAHRIGLQGKEENARAYEAGLILGSKEGKQTFTDHQLDVIKKLVETNKIDAGQSKVPLYGVVVTEQVLDLLKSAENVKK